jgi:hypothetical protein
MRLFDAGTSRKLGLLMSTTTVPNWFTTVWFTIFGPLCLSCHDFR